MLFGGSRGQQSRNGERRAHNAHTQTGVTPRQFLEGNHECQPRRVGVGVGEEIKTVNTSVGRGTNERPGGFFSFIPFVRDRSHRRHGEAVDPLLDGALFVVQRH